jgi:chemotaxis protein CheZ
MFHRVGQLTRTLHDALRELGYDRSLEKTVAGLPDARDRLDYIAKLTGQAAERVLAAVERGQTVQGRIGADGAKLSARWESLYAGKLSVEEFKALAGETRAYLGGVEQKSAEVGAQLHEVMMAQDFHDLTGQVIGRMVTMAQCMEKQLLQLLIDARPAGGGEAEQEWLTGPAMNAAGRSDVVANQEQVDKLLETLGF